MKTWILPVTYLILGTISSHADVKKPATASSLIIAEVYQDSITKWDLDERIRLIALTGGMGNDKNAINKLRPEVLLSLIQERLQIHAAKQQKIDVNEKEVNDAIEGIAKENNMTSDQLISMLKKNGISKECMASRIRAQIAWMRYIRHRYGPLITITEKEIDQELDKLEKNKNQKQYALSEILLLVTNPSKEQQVLAQAKQIVADLKNGGNFSGLARQLSKDPSAAQGGDLGWLNEQQLDPAVAARIDHLASGQVSDPIRTSGGYKIIKLRSKRLSGQADPGDTEITMCQVAFPITPESPQELIDQMAPNIEQILKVSGCERLKSSAQKFGASVEVSPKVQLHDLPDQLRQIVQKASIGKCSQPILTPNGLIITMVCSRHEAKYEAPSREDIKANLEHEKLSRSAGREMQKLMNTAYIQIKDDSLKNMVIK
jgi:peptidyl-prolyl cis-trans isomerase SurA